MRAMESILLKTFAKLNKCFGVASINIYLGMERILLSIHYKLMGEDGAIFSGLLK
jgi:hypothetical protein